MLNSRWLCGLRSREVCHLSIRFKQGCLGARHVTEVKGEHPVRQRVMPNAIAAFRLGLSPKIEIDDHKMYYGKRDLWPILVQSGFKPSQIQLRYHKFGLNLFAAARKSDA